jgi:acyl-coenzyme A thioesterase PaaI-like protein
LNIKQALAQWPQPQEDWETFRLPHSIGDGRPEFLGTGDERKLVTRFFRDRRDHSLQGHVWFADGCFGPPGHVHGGISAFVFDEALGCVTWMNDYTCVAIELTINYHRMTPLNEILCLNARIDSVDDDIVNLYGELYRDEEVFSSARGLFKVIDLDRFTQQKK